MEKENLTKTQIIMLILLSSFVVSFATGIIITTLAEQKVPQSTNTINRIIEKTIGIGATNFVNTEDKEKDAVRQLFITQEELIVNIVEKTNPSVVSIVATKDVPIVEQFFINPFDGDSFQGLIPDFQIPQYRQKGVEKKQVSSGTGFFVSDDGLILTNKHVVEDAQAEYTVIMNNGKKLPASIKSRDKFNDIAVLKVNGENYSFISLGESDKLKIGQTAIAIGNALGEFQNTVSVGVISGLNRDITASGAKSGPEELKALIQTDAAINPGNSGGPLLNLNGKAIGINTAIASGAQNIGFALPINIAKKSLEDIKKFGKIINPYLGVRYIIINEALKTANNLPVSDGALVKKGTQGEKAVMTGSPAEYAGIKENDIIIEFDGKKIDKTNTLSHLISEKKAGDSVLLKILRNGEIIAIKATLEPLPENL